MTLEDIKKIKDPVERALFEAAYAEAQKADTGFISKVTKMYLIYIGLILFVSFVFYIAIREYRRNNPRPKDRKFQHVKA